MQFSKQPILRIDGMCSLSTEKYPAEILKYKRDKSKIIETNLSLFFCFSLQISTNLANLFIACYSLFFRVLESHVVNYNQVLNNTGL